MKITVPKNLKEMKEHLSDPLYRNSYFLLLTSATSSILSFIFWMLVTHLYAPKEVGIVTALISAVGLLAGFSRIGLDFGLIKYLPSEQNKDEMINSCLTLVTLIAILLSLIFIAGIDFWSPALSFVKNDIKFALSFVAFTIFFSLTLLQQRVFLAFRRAEFAFLQATTNSGLKIILPPLFVSLGAFGIFLSWGVPSIVAISLSLFVFTPKLYKGYFPLPRIKKRVANELFHFSFGNYLAENFWNLPRWILPLLIIATLSAEMTAYFYIAWSIAFILYIIPGVIGDSLFTEGSYNRENLRDTTLNAIKFTFLILTPALALVFIFGDKVLLLFGKPYSENAFRLLLVLSLATIPYTLIQFYASIERIRGEVKNIMMSYTLIAILSIGISYILLPRIGIMGTGIGWLLAQSIVATIIGGIVGSEMMRRRKR